MMKISLMQGFNKGWQFGVAFFSILAAGSVARFIFDGRTLSEDWRFLLTMLAVPLVGGIVAGFAFHGLQKWERNRK